MKFDDDMMISTMKKRRSKRPRMGTSCTSSSSSSSSSREWDSTIQYFSSSSPSSSDLEEDMAANCLILLAQGRRHVHDDQEQQQLPPFMAAKELYAFKTCNRIFPSFQALGGHRASHKKLIKTSSPPAIIPSSSSSENQEQRYEEDLTTLSLQIHPMVSSNKNKMHDCSICGAEFTSGQALGGHMRRHRPLPPPTASSREQSKKARNLMSFDLNLPAAPAEEERRESSFPAAFAASKERVIVFSNSPLVDCHY